MVTEPTSHPWKRVWETDAEYFKYGVEVIAGPTPEDDFYKSYVRVWGRPEISHLTKGKPLTKEEFSEWLRKDFDEAMENLKRLRQATAKHFGW